MIGFIGLGIMGSRMAENLLNKGYDLVVHNRTKEKAQSLLDKGAQWADSPAEVARKADVVFTMLANPSIVEKIVYDQDGLFNGLSEGKLWVDSSTVDPAFSRKMAQEANSRGIRFLDAPVTGSKIPAEKAELVFLVGGKEEDLNEVRDMMNAMGKDISFQGENGMGASMKLVINLMLGQAMAVFSEAVALGEGMGLDREKVINTLLAGPTAAPALKGKKEKILQDEFSPEFPLVHLQKDLYLATKAGFENGVPMPIANVTKEIYAQAKQSGLSDQDFSAISRFLSSNKSVN